MYFMCVGSCVPSSPALALHKYNFNSAAAYCLPEKRNSTWVRKMKLFHRQHAPLAIHRQLHDASTSHICRTLRLYSFNIILLSCHCFYLSQETIKSESKILNFFSLFVFIYFFRGYNWCWHSSPLALYCSLLALSNQPERNVGQNVFLACQWYTDGQCDSLSLKYKRVPLFYFIIIMFRVLTCYTYYQFKLSRPASMNKKWVKRFLSFFQHIFFNFLLS